MDRQAGERSASVSGDGGEDAICPRARTPKHSLIHPISPDARALYPTAEIRRRPLSVATAILRASATVVGCTVSGNQVIGLS